MNTRSLAVGLIGVVGALVVGCGSSAGESQSSASDDSLTKCTEYPCGSSSSSSGGSSGTTVSSCYSGSYQGDTLQTLSSQGTMPGSVGVCASALLAAGCTKIGDPTSTLAVPYYVASASTAFLAIQCPTGTMARLNRDNRWVYGQYQNYGGYVWYNGNWAYLDSNYNTQLGTLYNVAAGTGGAIPVSKTSVIAYNVSTNWYGYAYAASCSSHPAWGSTNPSGTLYLNDQPCLTASSGWEADDFDPTCSSRCQ